MIVIRNGNVMRVFFKDEEFSTVCEKTKEKKEGQTQ